MKRSFDELNDGIDKVGAGLDKINDGISRFEDGIDKFGRTFDGINNDIDDWMDGTKIKGFISQAVKEKLSDMYINNKVFHEIVDFLDGTTLDEFIQSIENEYNVNSKTARHMALWTVTTGYGLFKAGLYHFKRPIAMTVERLKVRTLTRLYTHIINNIDQYANKISLRFRGRGINLDEEIRGAIMGDFERSWMPSFMVGRLERHVVDDIIRNWRDILRKNVNLVPDVNKFLRDASGKAILQKLDEIAKKGYNLLVGKDMNRAAAWFRRSYGELRFSQLYARQGFTTDEALGILDTVEGKVPDPVNWGDIKWNLAGEQSKSIGEFGKEFLVRVLSAMKPGEFPVIERVFKAKEWIDASMNFVGSMAENGKKLLKATIGPKMIVALENLGTASAETMSKAVTSFQKGEPALEVMGNLLKDAGQGIVTHGKNLLTAVPNMIAQQGHNLMAVGEKVHDVVKFMTPESPAFKLLGVEEPSFFGWMQRGLRDAVRSLPDGPIKQAIGSLQSLESLPVEEKQEQLSIEYKEELDEGLKRIVEEKEEEEEEEEKQQREEVEEEVGEDEEVEEEPNVEEEKIPFGEEEKIPSDFVWENTPRGIEIRRNFYQRVLGKNGPLPKKPSDMLRERQPTLPEQFIKENEGVTFGELADRAAGDTGEALLGISNEARSAVSALRSAGVGTMAQLEAKASGCMKWAGRSVGLVFIGLQVYDTVNSIRDSMKITDLEFKIASLLGYHDPMIQALEEKKNLNDADTAVNVILFAASFFFPGPAIAVMIGKGITQASVNGATADDDRRKSEKNESDMITRMENQYGADADAVWICGGLHEEPPSIPTDEANKKWEASTQKFRSWLPKLKDEIDILRQQIQTHQGVIRQYYDFTLTKKLQEKENLLAWIEQNAPADTHQAEEAKADLYRRARYLHNNFMTLRLLGPRNFWSRQRIQQYMRPDMFEVADELGWIDGRNTPVQIQSSLESLAIRNENRNRKRQNLGQNDNNVQELITDPRRNRPQVGQWRQIQQYFDMLEEDDEILYNDLHGK